jgi:hypothetical protein
MTQVVKKTTLRYSACAVISWLQWGYSSLLSRPRYKRNTGHPTDMEPVTGEQPVMMELLLVVAGRLLVVGLQGKEGKQPHPTGRLSRCVQGLTRQPTAAVRV